MDKFENYRFAQSWCIISVLLFLAAFLLPDIGVDAGDQLPAISVNRSNLNFGSIKEGDQTSSATNPQQILISNSGGGGIMDWSIQKSASWLNCTPTSGMNTGTVTVSVSPCGLEAGSYTGTVKVFSPNATNSPQTVTVNLNVKEPQQDQAPFGSFTTPIHGSTVRSSIPVTGWVLDDVAVNNVKIYNDTQYIGDAVFVEGARPDVEQAYPTYPNNFKGGWGYMLLTNFLLYGGNGTYTINAIATDSEGQQTNLGSKTIYCDNAHAVKPFGDFDTPKQGGTASGSDYANGGWVLTPQPNSIAMDGSTINVYVDGVNIGHPYYNLYRSDIARLFPGYNNSNGAGGNFILDTTAYENGVHTIQWSATDNAGNNDGIGSRYFTISNSSANMVQTNSVPSSVAEKRLIQASALNEIPTDYTVPVQYRTGYDNSAPLMDIAPDSTGVMYVSIRESDRIEVFLNETGFTGYSHNSDMAGPLPIGSTLNTSGTFYWIPGPGFMGTFELVFIRGQVIKTKKVLKITIIPKQAPSPHIKANGQEGLISVPSGTSVAISLNLNLNNYASQSADWWVVTYTPSGQWMYFDLNTWAYVAGFSATFQGALFDFNDFTLINLSNLPAGTHSFFFGLDLAENGLLDMDQLYYGSVSVVVTE